MTLKRAFAQSVNSIAARLGQQLGIERIAKTAHRLGIKSELNEIPPLVLGASDVNLLEMVNAYSTVVNDGMSHDVRMVTRILDRDGHEVYNAQPELKQAITYHSAFMMQQLLLGGMREPGGTSMRLWEYVREFDDTDFGGKTGTSNNHSDAWFMGISPKLVCGAWVGGEYRAIHFRTGQLGQGSRTALPICGRFFKSVLSDKRFSHYHGKFEEPHSDTILPEMYNCWGYSVPSADEVIDSLGFGVFDNYDDEVLPYDEMSPATIEESPASDPVPVEPAVPASESE